MVLTLKLLVSFIGGAITLGLTAGTGRENFLFGL